MRYWKLGSFLYTPSELLSNSAFKTKQNEPTAKLLLFLPGGEGRDKKSQIHCINSRHRQTYRCLVLHVESVEIKTCFEDIMHWDQHYFCRSYLRGCDTLKWMVLIFRLLLIVIKRIYIYSTFPDLSDKCSSIYFTRVKLKKNVQNIHMDTVQYMSANKWQTKERLKSIWTVVDSGRIGSCCLPQAC